MPENVVAHIASTHIVHVPQICGGSATFEGTRLSIWLIIAELQNGMAEERLLHNFPQLTEEHLARAKEYYENNRAEIDADIKANDE